LDHSVKGQPLSFSSYLGEFLRHNLSWFLGAALALLLLQDIFGTHGLIAMRRSQQEAEQVQQEISQLDEENRQLQDSVQSLKSDPTAIEHIAREEMGLAKPGEYIFKIAPRSSSTGTPAGPAANPPKKP
jgi:cell division protein FtsL